MKTPILLFIFITGFHLSTLGGNRIAYFFALDEDIASFQMNASPPISSIPVGDVVVHQYSVDGKRVYAAKMGSGCVRTAATAQAVLTRFPCDLVISTGPAGGIGGAGEIGQWRRVERVVAYQSGSHTSTGKQLSRSSEFHLDHGRLAHALGSLSELPTASVASGERFIASNAYRDEIASQYDCDLVDMNLFGLLMVIQSRDLPSVHLRVISDFANDQASAEFRSFSEDYDGRGGELACAWIRRLPADPCSPMQYENLRRLLEPPAAP